jgi:hypothetical protein
MDISFLLLLSASVGIKLRILYMQGKCLSTQQHPRPLDIDFKMILFAVGPKYPNGP